MNTIKITRTFRLQLRNLFVINGQLLSGDVEKGMYLFNNGKPSNFQIFSVESIIDSGKGSLGITFYFKNNQELEILEKLIRDRDTIEFKK